MSAYKPVRILMNIMLLSLPSSFPAVPCFVLQVGTKAEVKS